MNRAFLNVKHQSINIECPLDSIHALQPYDERKLSLALKPPVSLHCFGTKFGK